MITVEEKAKLFDQVCDIFNLGELARGSNVLVNVRNCKNFTDKLHAIEREYFMTEGEPDDNYPGELPDPVCMLNSWGNTLDEYVQNFGSALTQIHDYDKLIIENSELKKQRKTLQNLLANYAASTGAGANDPDVIEALLFDENDQHISTKSTAPVVNWQSPDLTPDVPKGETKTFWIATRFKRKGEWEIAVFDAQYVNKPLEYAEDDIDKEYPLDDDHFVNEDGEAMEAMGWHSLMEHADFHGYYEPIVFSDDREFLGWGEYQKPEFKL